MNVYVKLRIAGNGLDFDEISVKLNRQPDFTYNKGEVFVDKYAQKTIVYEEDCWLAETKNSNDETPQECVEKFVLSFKESSDYIRNISSEFDVMLWISAYPDEEHSSLQLSENTISILSEMGVSLNYDVDFLKSFYDGTYEEN